MARIIAYTYEGSCHCIACTQVRFSKAGEKVDECGIPFLTFDKEKNPIHPIFDTDELPTDLFDEDGGSATMACDTCSDVIRGRAQ